MRDQAANRVNVGNLYSVINKIICIEHSFTHFVTIITPTACFTVVSRNHN